MLKLVAPKELVLEETELMGSLTAPTVDPGGAESRDIALTLTRATGSLATSVLYLERSMYRESHRLASGPERQLLLEARMTLCRLRRNLMSDYARFSKLADSERTSASCM